MPGCDRLGPWFDHLFLLCHHMLHPRTQRAIAFGCLPVAVKVAQLHFRGRCAAAGARSG